jgi:hypothetical protein
MARTFGASDYVDLADNAALADSVFSVAVWLKTTNTGVWEFLSRHDASNSRNGWGFYNNNASPARVIVYRKDNSTGNYTVGDTGSNIVDGNWHAVLARIDRAAGGAIELTVDGVTNTGIGTNATNYNSNIPLRIGRSTDGFWSGFVGDLANFALWNGRLSDDEVAAFCKGMSPGQIRPSALRAWLPLRT